MCPRFIRVEHGSETSCMGVIRPCVKESLCKGQEDTWKKYTQDVVTGSSVTNVVIERFFFKPRLNELANNWTIYMILHKKV